MIKKTVELKNRTGLHARPASNLVKLATQFKCNVFIAKDGKKVTAKSILGLLTLSLNKGSVIDVIVDGEGQEEALEKIVNYIENLEE